jgi:hypothetical protein
VSILTDAIIAVSDGVSGDLALMGGVPRHRIVTIHNPIVHADLAELSRARLDHPWFAAGEPPVVLGVGRLNKQKDFATLLDAFRRLCTRRQARLMILEGRERLPLAPSISISGSPTPSAARFVDNPFAYMGAPPSSCCRPATRLQQWLPRRSPAVAR